MCVYVLLLQVWAELLVLLAEGEMEAQPWDQERARPHRAAALQASGSNAAAAAAAGDAQQQQQRGWQLLVNEFRRQEVVRRVVQVRQILTVASVFPFGANLFQSSPCLLHVI
jgi:hypothetical protein